jgi:chitin disaccharide deacetylase
MLSSNEIGLVTRADDVGTFRSVTAATYDANHNGILRNASLMAPTPFIEEAAAGLIGKTDLCFGAHLTMTSEWRTVKWGPVLDVSAVPSLVDKNGHLFSTPMRLHRRGVVFDEMLAECKAQLAKLRSLGFPISYIDTHMGFAWLFENGDESRRFEDVLREWAREEGVIYMPPLRRMKRVCNSSDDLVSDLVELLEKAKPGVHIRVGHPCFDDDEMRAHLLRNEAPGVQAARRDAQRRQFTDPRVLEVVERRGIRAMTYIEAVEALSVAQT